MRIAITGGTGFVGRHLAQRLLAFGHQPILLARGNDRRYPLRVKTGGQTALSPRRREISPVGRDGACALEQSRQSPPVIHTDLSEPGLLAEAVRGCDAIAHCAGINREIGPQTYRRVHIEGTRNLIEAARYAGVSRLLMLSFLRARPNCGLPYHESKFQAEELVRQSGLDYTVLKAGMIYGRGDHMLNHLSHMLFTLPLVATVGLNQKPIRPVAIDDVTRIIVAALTEGRLSRQTVFVLGPETLPFSQAVRRIATVLGRRVWIVPAPVVFHRILAAICESTMKIPLVARAQVRMLAEGFLEAAPPAGDLPEDLKPQLRFTTSQIRQGLPDPGPFTLEDFRFPACQHGG